MLNASGVLRSVVTDRQTNKQTEYCNPRCACAPRLNELKRRTNPVNVKTFPNYSSDPKGQHYAQYCKYQLIKYKPWQQVPENAWDNQQASDDMFVALYRQFLASTNIHQLITDHTLELERAEHYHRQQDQHNEEDDTYQTSTYQEEWMYLCQLNPSFRNEHISQSESDSVDWESAANELEPSRLLSCPNWIQTNRVQCSTEFQAPTRFLDIATLNQAQRKAYDIVSHHFTHHPHTPLRMMILGTAGTGKSYLISCLAQLLLEKCLLTGTTGIAGFNIDGVTIHSALQLPVLAIKKTELSGLSLASLQNKLKYVKYIILDEVSMLGQRTMAWIDKRLRQASGRQDVPFGGYSLILIGDFAQLPPVGDRPLYASDQPDSHGYVLYHLFDKVVILDEMVRQNGTTPDQIKFRDLRLRLRNGETTEEDWSILLSRAPSAVSNSADFDDAVHLFYNKDKVAQFNIKKLNSLKTPIARINAKHSSCVAASAKADDAGGLQPVLLIAKDAKVMLKSNLWQHKGLCNGATGVVKDILYASGQKPPNLPIAVLVRFDKFTGPPFLSTDPKSIPIPPITFEWTNGSSRLSRQQLPLMLSYAITIHKSQGQTLSKAVIDIGDREMAAGATFVALSRLRKITDGLIQPMSYDRLKSISKLKRLQQRLIEEQRLSSLVEP